jgi:uncharacterized 2Fe-2S/4Fe-4S cluster protein (DUF4445 family)
MALLSRHAFARAKNLANQMTYFELSVNPDFMNEFVASLFLPHTDINLFPTVRNVMEITPAGLGDHFARLNPEKLGKTG